MNRLYSLPTYVITLCLLIINSTHCAQSVYIIIHGTWCTPFSWHMPGGDFHNALQASAKQYDASVTFLQWSGKNSHKARTDGAHQLVHLIKTYHSDDEINLVAHSHGGNVAMLASHLLAGTAYTINNFFALGTPIDKKRYAPNMQKIHTLYNLFSFGDMVQTVGKIFQRELPTTSNCHNVRIELNQKHPNHCALHDSMIGGWIPIVEFWEKLSDKKEYLIPFKTGECPILLEDINRKKFREKNLALLALYNDPLRRITVRGFLPFDPTHH